jgi:hypothetical protein
MESWRDTGSSSTRPRTHGSSLATIGTQASEEAGVFPAFTLLTLKGLLFVLFGAYWRALGAWRIGWKTLFP